MPSKYRNFYTLLVLVYICYTPIVKKALFILTTCGLSWVFGQNLVPNASMETNTGCPTAPGQTNLATGWFNGLQSPDYHHTCNTGTIGAPNNVFGNQVPYDGNGYLGLVTVFVSANWRESAGIQLTSPLVPGQMYQCRMLVSLGDLFSIGSDGLGFQFNTAPTSAMNNTAQVYATTPIIDQTNWTVISGTFTAAAAYTYVFIGNFFDDANTNTAATGSGSAAWCYYYIDSVSVTPFTPLPVELASFEGECNNGLTELNWSTSSEINNAEFTIERSADGINYKDIGRVTGAGNSNELTFYTFTDADLNSSLTYYRLKQTDFDGNHEYFDPITTNCNPWELPIIIKPNPNPGRFQVSGLNETARFSMTNSQGAIVYKTEISGSDSYIDVSWLNDGVYYAIIETNTGKSVEKIVITK